MSEKNPEKSIRIVCTYCPRAFTKTCDYNRHNKKHTKPYRCTICPYNCSLRTDLVRHQRTHNGASAKFLCLWPHCKFKGSNRQDNLWRHMTRTHTSNSVSWEESSPLLAMKKLFEKSVQGTKPLVREQNQDISLSLSHALAQEDVLLGLDLVRQGADINQTDSKGQSLLHLAVLIEASEAFHALLRHKGIDPDRMCNQNRTSLSLAAESGKHEIVSQLLSLSNVTAGSQDKLGRTPLHFAAQKGHSIIVQTLIGRSTREMFVADRSMRTPLHLALKAGQKDVAQILLSCSDMDLTHDVFHPPLTSNRDLLRSAINADCLGMIKVLQERNILNTTAGRGFDLAVNCGRLEIVEYFFGQGLIGEKVKKRRSPMGSCYLVLKATYNGHEDVVNFLMAHGFAYDIDDIILAASLGNSLQHVESLLKNGAKLNTGELAGKALTAAVKAENELMIRLLLESGASMRASSPLYYNIVTKSVEPGQSALKVAAGCKNGAMLRQLLEYQATQSAQIDKAFADDLVLGALSAAKLDLWANVQTLINAGMPPEDLERFLIYALDSLYRYGNDKGVQVLTKWTALVTCPSNLNASLLYFCSGYQWRSYSSWIATKLLELGANVDSGSTTEEGSALLQASVRGFKNVVKVLTEHGANLNLMGPFTVHNWHNYSIRTERRCGTALQAAQAKGNHEIVTLLREAGATEDAHGSQLIEVL